MRGRALHVVAELGPHRRLCRGVQVRVAKIAVEKMKQRLEAFDRINRVTTLRR